MTTSNAFIAYCCRICGSTEIDAPISLRESMFGTGEQFAYHRCAKCSCLQIVEQPADMGRYYPRDYYSYAAPAPGALQRLKKGIRTFLSLYGSARLFAGYEWWELGDRKSLREADVCRSDRILDIGCGRGDLISGLRDIGFRNVIGVDPFIAGEFAQPNGVKVLKRAVDEIEGQYDLIMMHHSLEHIWDQHQTAREIARLLAPGGRCVIRIPTIDSWAWEEYGPDWVQLDPPRHFYLHSRSSITRLLEACGLEVSGIVDDSSAFQILGSEKIRRRQPLINPDTDELDYGVFLPAELIASAAHRARQLNRSRRGDSIAVHAQMPRR